MADKSVPPAYQPGRWWGVSDWQPRTLEDAIEQMSEMRDDWAEMGRRLGFSSYADPEPMFIRASVVGNAASMEPWRWALRIGDSDVWGFTGTQEEADFIGAQSGLKFEKRPCYSAPVIGPDMEAARDIIIELLQCAEVGRYDGKLTAHARDWLASNPMPFDQFKQQHLDSLVGEVQGDGRITMSEDDFTRMVEGEAGEHGEMLEDGGPFSGWCFSCEGLIEFSRSIINSWGMERRAQAAALAARQPGAQEPVEFDYPEFHQEGMGCGLEDRGITDRYEAMRYGFDEALDQMAVILDSIGPLYAAPPAQGIDLGQAVPPGMVVVQIADAKTLCAHVKHSPRSALAARRVEALIDQHDAAPGAGNG